MVLKFENIPRHSFFFFMVHQGYETVYLLCGSAAPHLACLSKNLENKVCYSKTVFIFKTVT